MSRIETVTSYNLSYDQGQIVADKPGFDIDAYSGMKHGNRRATQAFAAGLAEELARDIPELTIGESTPDFLVAYKSVPPACYYLSRYCLERINEQRLDQGLEPGRVTQVFKDRVTATNYASSSSEARSEELQSIGFSLNGHSIDGRPAVILDDVRITGAAEERIVATLASEKPSHLALGYVAIFDAAQAAANPSVEHDLNSASVTCITDILPSIEQDNFDLNIRTLKLILDKSSDNEREDFLQDIPKPLLYSLYNGAVSTGPEFIVAYQSAVNQIVKALDLRARSK